MSRDLSKWCAGALVGLLIGSVGAEMWARDRIAKAEERAYANETSAMIVRAWRQMELPLFCERYAETIARATRPQSERAKGEPR